jgi:hypothetical protein
VSVWGRNNKYYFELRAFRPEGPFRLVYYRKIRPNDDDLQYRLARLELVAATYRYAGFLVGTVPLPSMLEEGTLKISSLAPQSDNSEDSLSLVVYTDIDSGVPCHRYGDGRFFNASLDSVFWDSEANRYLPFTVTVAPHDNFRIVRIDGASRRFVEPISKPNRRARPYKLGFQFQWHPDNRHWVSREMQEAECLEPVDGIPTKVALIHEYYDWSDERPHRSEFYLTAFGLPEPVDLQTRQGRSLFWWLAAAGLTCIVIGFGLWRWYEWHQQKHKPA